MEEINIGKQISEFSFKLYQKLQNNNNLVFSPASIYIALAMTAIGSQTKTLEQFKKLLNFDSSLQLSKDASQLQTHLVKNQQGINIQIANKIYQGIPKLGQDYESIMLKHFESAFELVNFAKYPDEIRGQINEWVSNMTNKKIKDLIPQGAINDLTRMVLVNAIYFKGNWKNKFQKEQTHKQNFNLEYENNGKQVIVDFMFQKDSFSYYESYNYQFISIPYQGDEYAMEIILPKTPLQQFEKTLNNNLFQQSRQMKTKQKLSVYIPKFKIDQSSFNSMKQQLKELGIEEAFEDSADFSLMDPQNGIKISDVIHKAMIEVNEEGAEAAAATAVIFKAKATCKSIEKSMICNKPFFYSITHIPTSTILFMGKIINPLIS